MALASPQEWHEIYRQVSFDPKRVAEQAAQSLSAAEQASDVAAQLAAWRRRLVSAYVFDITIPRADMERSERLARSAADTETLCVVLLYRATLAAFGGDAAAGARLRQEASHVAQQNGDGHCAA